jgi:predicted nucleic acid-binding protein
VTVASGAAVYVDSSVIVAALSADDPRHAAARRVLQGQRLRISSVLAEVEVRRALRRRGADRRLEAAGRRLVATCELVEVAGEIRAAAAELTPTILRSLDAIHLASALATGVTAFHTFDDRQRVAAEEAGLAVGSERTYPGSVPVATGREGSLTHSLHDPG